MSNSIDTEVALIRQELSQSTSMMDKLEKVIEKISDVNYNMSKMIAIHEDRMQRIEKATEENSSLFEKRDVQVKKEMQDMQEEIAKKIDDSENRVTKALESMKLELKADFKEHKEQIEESISSIEEKSAKTDNRIEALEKWRWIITGGAMFAGILISKIDVVTKVLANVIAG